MLSKVFVGVVIALSVGGVFGAGRWAWRLSRAMEDASTAEDVDSICERELEGSGHAEARSWVSNPRNIVLGLADPLAVLGLVNTLYEAGAEDVQVTQLQGSRLQQTASAIVVVLPAGSGDAVVAAAERGLGLGDDQIPISEDAELEDGERYLRITFHALDDANDVAVGWGTERELREASRAERRGFEAEGQ